jgi:formate dehydrogenase beta subunit
MNRTLATRSGWKTPPGRPARRSVAPAASGPDLGQRAIGPALLTTGEVTMSPPSNDLVALQGPPGRHRGGRPGGRMHARGRSVQPTALDEVRELLGHDRQDRRYLVEHLHAIQDRHGHLGAAHLCALAQELNLTQAQVYEVATFYSQFIVVREGEPAPPATVVRVCDGLACTLEQGARTLEDCRRRLEGEALVLRAPCMGRCDRAPVASVNQRHVEYADLARVRETIAAGKLDPVVPPYRDAAGYVTDGGYRLLQACLAGVHRREAIFETLSDAKLRGLGGAGYPTGQKWRSVARLPKPKVLVVNFDESEMGTFKDRHLVERDPHRLIEGALVAAWACEADQGYIYLRDEYHSVRAMLERELAQVKAAGLSEHCELTLVRGAGAYVCGERSAMLESIEGKRGYPRLKDPRTTVVGLFGIPTLINNVETLYWVRDIIEQGPAWFAGQGRHGRPGPRAFSVSGRVKHPGVKLAPAGITMNELLHEHCGGMRDGHHFKGYCVGGAAGGLLPASLADIPLDFDTLEPYGCAIGSGAITVFSNHDPVRDIVRTLMQFFEDESCGQCTPCRVGTQKAVLLLDRTRWDELLLGDLCDVLAEGSICGLGTSAPLPIRSALRYFREELGLGEPSGHD